jgi:LPXTG-motif cell wall-anchored protein
LKDWAVSQPMLAGALSLSIGGFWLWSKKKAAP